MAQKTDAQLATQKNEIKNETVANANTANRIGQMFEDNNDSKINNDKIDTDNGLATADKTIPGRDAVKNYIATQIAAAVAGLLDLRGTFDASVNAYPSSGGSGSAGAILKADAWVISVAGTLPTGQAVSVGDLIFAIVDTPGNTQANWARLEMNLLAATESAAGILEIATQAETNTGTDDARAVTPLKLKNRDGAVATLSDGGTVDITSDKNTLATSSSRTFTISHTGDDISLVITLSATSATQTFPSGSLCVSEGLASGDNTCSMSGVSGDKYVIAIKKMGSNYYVVCKNFGQ